jgi:hypothetical protein
MPFLEAYHLEVPVDMTHDESKLLIDGEIGVVDNDGVIGFSQRIGCASGIDLIAALDVCEHLFVGDFYTFLHEFAVATMRANLDRKSVV